MQYKAPVIKALIGVAFLIWTAIILSMFYITQHPQFLQLANGLVRTFWSLMLLAILLFDSAGLGGWILQRLQLQANAQERLLLGTGIGLGALGLAGYALGAAGLSKWWMLAGILFGMLVWFSFTKFPRTTLEELKPSAADVRQSWCNVPRWIAPAVLFTALLGFFSAFLPPAEGFDSLVYHLALPERLLADKQILPYNIFPFWHPGLIEGDFLWALGLGSEQTAQLIHWSFAMLTLALVWEWSRTIFGDKAAWWALALLVSMPSLPLISSWAYTDMAQTFMGLACLYAIWQWRGTHQNSWLVMAGILAGMDMGIKYTSFILPVMCGVLILIWERGWSKRINSVLLFSVPALLLALPWYLRNWLIMGNPFYPFVFGGRYWDPFRAQWFGGIGTGIGWNLGELLMLPLTVTLGYRDKTYFESRMGPLFLLFFPLAVWAIWRKRSAPSAERDALLLQTAFFGLSTLFWTYGVIQTVNLWQARYLWPGLVPFAIPIGLGISCLHDLDLSRLRISFIISTMIGLVILVTSLDNFLFLTYRMPLVYALGMDTRSAYFQRIQPGYLQALELVDSTPANSSIYFIVEPRSYGMTRKVQPDVSNENLMHDFYLYKTADAILNSWRAKGYTHVLVNKKFIPLQRQSMSAHDGDETDRLLAALTLVQDREYYWLYAIPPQK